MRASFLSGVAMACLCACPAAAQAPARSALATGLAEETVEVRINYSGARIALFMSAPDLDEQTSFAVALFGPPVSQTVIANDPDRRRRAVFPSAASVFVRSADPGFFERVTPDALDAAGLGLESATGPLQGPPSVQDNGRWRDALVRLKQNEGLYLSGTTGIDNLGGGLRRARLDLPSDAPPGAYRVRAVAFSKGRIVAESEQTLTLVRSGLDETLYELARRFGFAYGLLGLLLAACVGGAAAWIGRRA